jgi:hypothetical protein
LLAGHYHEFSAMRVLNRTGDVAAASAELDRGIRIMYDLNSPQQARSMMVLAARMYGHLGDCAMAVELYERTWELALRPDEEWTLDDLRILVELADCHAKRGEHDAAAKVRARAWPYLAGVYTAFADQLRARLSGPDAPGSG